jgi:hypothetical protein
MALLEKYRHPIAAEEAARSFVRDKSSFRLSAPKKFSQHGEFPQSELAAIGTIGTIDMTVSDGEPQSCGGVRPSRVYGLTQIR